jgi:hydroxymethylbilane synthase
MPNPTIRLGTRASKLALTQSNWVKAQLEKLGNEVELIEIKTEGDVRTGPLAQIGGQGLFTKRLQHALVDSEIDLAVHSLKDLPTEDHPELKIAAVPPREKTADALVGRDGVVDLASLPNGAKVGTGSVRRAAQLLHLRPDLNIFDIRGNVDTRLKKLETEGFDAIILACAGLNRMGLADRITYAFDENELLPAVGQGALGLEVRASDAATIAAVQVLNDDDSFCRAMAERAMLRRLFAGCLAPVGAVTKVQSQVVQLTGVVLSRDGQTRIQCSNAGPVDRPGDLGVQVAEALMEQGAEELLRKSV